MNTIRTALISVSDKTGVVEFAAAIASRGIQILSTGGTAKLLAENDITVTDVSDHTGFNEIMDGRVKTLHPKIHGGILGRRGVDETVMEDNAITPIDLVVVNLYPFEETIANPNCDLSTAIENIDIGGPTMLRAAAKNHAHVTVVVDQNDFKVVLSEMTLTENIVSDATRFDLAVKAFEHTARYDGAIANYLGAMVGENQKGEKLIFRVRGTSSISESKLCDMGKTLISPQRFTPVLVRISRHTGTVASAVQLQGKALSYNNIGDTDAALECVKQFQSTPACVIVKHANPCGVAISATQLEAYTKAFQTDPESAFGGIIAFNTELDENTAAAIVGKQFVEVIIAPSASKGAIDALSSKENVRLLICGALSLDSVSGLDMKRVQGGLLLQSQDSELTNTIQLVTERKPDESENARS